MLKLRQIILSLFLLTCFAQNIIAQEILFDHYGPEEGFYNTQGLSLCKSSNGFLWIGTESGLVRYDGHSFLRFNTFENVECGLEYDYIRQIVEDGHGRLWLKSDNHLLNVFDIKSNKAKSVKFPKLDDNNFDITSVNYDRKNDRVWIGTTKGIFYNQGDKLELKQLDIKGIKFNFGIQDIQVDDANFIWILNTYGIFQYNPKTGYLQQTKRNGSNPNIDEDEGFTTSYLGNDTTMWIGMWVHGLAKFNPKTGTMKTFTWKDANKVQNGILCILEDHKDPNKLWLGATDGLLSFDKTTEKFESYYTTEIDDKYKVGGAVFSLFDSQEGLWIGSFKGLHKYDYNKNFIRTFPLNFQNIYGNNKISEIQIEKNLNGKDSIIWFSFNNGEIYRFDIINQKLISLPLKLQKYFKKFSEIYALYIDSKNILWISLHKYGIISYDLKSDKLMELSVVDRANNEPVVLNFKEDLFNKKMWMGGVNSMYYYNYFSEGDIHLVDELETYSHSIKYKLIPYHFEIIDKDNLIILATSPITREYALIKYSIKKISNNCEIIKDKELSKLSSINSICKISKNNFLVSTIGQTYLIDINQKIKIEKFPNLKGKRHYLYKSIKYNGSNHIILSEDYGLAVYNIADKSLSDYNYYNSNIKSSVQPAFAVSPNINRIYIGGYGKINYFDIDKLPKIESPAPIISNYRVENFAGNEILKSGDRLSLKYNQNKMLLEFTNFNFTNSSDNLYQYQLNNSDWNSCDNNKINFENLSWGKYKLVVQSYNSYGKISEGNFVLYFDISPPYYRSWWFNLALLFLVSAIIYGTFKYKEKQRQKLENLRMSIARDLHDDMGSHLSHIRILSEMEALKNDDNQVFNKISSKLSEVMSNMSEIVWSINPNNDSIQNLNLKIQEFAFDILEPLGINLEFDIDEINDKWKLSLDARRNIYLIFKEAINNIAKYSKANNVKLSIKQNGHTLYCTIKDDGIGFDPDLIKKGNGLKNMKLRAKLLGASFDIKTSNRGTIIDLIIKM